jgi:hypothetical protein
LKFEKEIIYLQVSKTNVINLFPYFYRPEKIQLFTINQFI